MKKIKKDSGGCLIPVAAAYEFGRDHPEFTRVERIGNFIRFELCEVNKNDG